MTKKRTRADETLTPRTFGYCRVSTRQQANEGHSLADQQQRIAGYCQANGLPAPSQFFVDAATSGTVSLQKREQGALLLADLRKGDHIIVTKGDRLFRSAKNALEIAESLRDKGVGLHLMDMGGEVLNSSVSRLVFGILMMVANMESERIGERTASVKEHLRAQGRFVGGAVPFGYAKTADGALKRRKDFSSLQKRISEMSRKGHSTRAIAQTLTEDGTPVSHNTIYRLLDGRRKTDAHA
ncbi:MAG: resolvase [Acidimicrobiia bacterium]|nr:resolvase [Acidimicrobiia bacterium]